MSVEHIETMASKNNMCSIFGGKKISLTEEGIRLSEIAAKMLFLEDSIINGKDSGEVSGRSRVGFCDSLCVNRLPRLIAEFKELHPDVNFSLEILKCSDFYSKLAGSTLDIAFTIGYLKKEQDINYIAEREEKICVFSSPEHPLAGKKKFNARDFNKIPLIMAETAAYYRQNFLRELEENGITVNIMIETESIQAIKNITEKGLGIPVLPRTAVLQDLKSGSLIELNYACDYKIQSYIILHKNKHLFVCTKRFMEFSAREIERENAE